MREPGPTFRLPDIGWIDWESKSDLPIEVGAYRYLTAATPLILAYAIGEGPARALPYRDWQDLPQEIRDHHARVQAGDAIWAAWNASFDREVWNQLTDYPEMVVNDIIDVMAQATAAGLPGKLETAALFAGAPVKKRPSGRALIRLFCEPGATATPQSHPAEWAEFLLYAGDDIEAMRGVFKLTLQLPMEEWEEYWTSERINLKGIAFDPLLAEQAAKMAKADRVISAVELHQLTGGVVGQVTEVKKMLTWLDSALEKADRSYLVRVPEEYDEETGKLKRKEKLTLDRAHIKLITAMLDAKPTLTESERKARRLLDIRQYGGSTTPAKFTKMQESHLDGLLMGQFVFNGAPQTGRFSSRGIQLHNLMRDALDYELDAIDALRNGIEPGQFATLGDGTPICRKLSMLIRPTLVPENDDNALVWGDWSQIEARVLPWLAGADHYLNIFREVDADPSKPDLYMRSASDMTGIPVEQIDKPLRQRGKVAILACGFGGGKNALQNMAAAYGMHLDDDQAKEIVREWREANPWAVDFWAQLWDAFIKAMEAPGHFFEAGKVGYIFLKDYLGGTVLCRLPSGRFITYRRVRWERVDETDDAGVVIDSKWELTFARAFGRIKLWPGFLSENVTQATAADVLRGTLTRLDGAQWMPPVRAHTHDEVLTEAHVDRADEVAERLIATMEMGFDWSTGLPIKADPTIGYAYTKCEAAQGL